MARGAAHDLDTRDSLGREYRPSKLAWDMDDRAPLPCHNIRAVNGPIDLDDPPPMASSAHTGRAQPQHEASRPRPGKARPLQTNRSGSDPRRPARAWLIWTGGGLVSAVSFVVAMLMTKPARPPTAAMATLAGSTISDLSGLMSAVKNAGLRGTPDVKGGIDPLTRRDNDQVTLKGWAAEISGGDAPLAVMVFVDGRYNLTMETSGGRPDIAASLGLSDAASANISFQGTLTCGRGQKLIVLAIAQSGVYGHFGTRLCP
jgi:hypothetical protein